MVISLAPQMPHGRLEAGNRPRACLAYISNNNNNGDILHSHKSQIPKCYRSLIEKLHEAYITTHNVRLTNTALCATYIRNID